MVERINIKDPSPLVTSVLALDARLAEMKRLGAKIIEMDLKTDFDYEQATRLVGHFTESAQNMAAEVTNLSGRLTEVRAEAEAVTAAVSARSQLLNSRKSDEDKKLDEFRQLGEQVRELTVAMSKVKPQEGHALSAAERVELTKNLADFETQLNPLIEKLHHLHKEAQASKMKLLAQNTESLAQTLQNVRGKLSSFH